MTNVTGVAVADGDTLMTGGGVAVVGVVVSEMVAIGVELDVSGVAVG